MNTCKEFYDKMILFEELDPQEQQKMKYHLQTCANCRKQFKEFRSIDQVLNNMHHLSENIVTRYGLYLADPKTPDYDGQKLSSAEIVKIEHHVKLCPTCAHKISEIKQEYKRIESFLDEAGVPAIDVGKVPGQISVTKKMAIAAQYIGDGVSQFFSRRFYPILTASAVAVVVVMLLVLVKPYLKKNANLIQTLAYIKQEPIDFAVRDDLSPLFNQAVQSFNNSHFDVAINSYIEFIAQTKDSMMLAYAHSLLGTSYLLASQEDFLKWTYKYNYNFIDNGIFHLEAALRLTNNSRIHEDAYWFLIKAYLMKNDLVNARSAAKMLILLDGKRTNNAQELIARLDRIEQKE
jgi:hypothetical protein